MAMRGKANEAQIHFPPAKGLRLDTMQRPVERDASYPIAKDIVGREAAESLTGSA